MLLEDGRMWLCLLVSVSRWQEVSPAPGCCQHHASHTVALGRQNWFHVITPDFTNTKSFSIYMLKLSRFSPGLCLGCLFSQILLIIGSGSGSGKVAGVRWLQWPVAVQGSGPRSSRHQPPADTQGRTFVPGWGPHLTSSPHHILTPQHTGHEAPGLDWHPSPSLGLASWYKRDLCPCCWLSWERVTVQSTGQIRSHPLHLLPRQSCSYRVTALSAHSTQVHYHCSGGSLVFGSSSLLSEALFVTTYSPLVRPHCVML